MVILIGVGLNFVLIQFQSNVPYAAVMFMVGTVLGMLATIQGTGCCNAFILSTLMWTQIDSNVLLLTILPGLILRDAMEVNFDIFMLALGQLLLLAYPMVLLGTVLTACACFYVLPWDWPWSLTLTLGSILGSTDPIAVASVLKRLGAPPRLQLHLGGESTLNDGSAMVFFNVFSQIWFSSLPGTNIEEVNAAEGFALFFQNALGGLAVGLASAIGLLYALFELDRRMEPEYNILQAGAALTMSYLSYYVADRLLHMSGVTASVTVGILAKAFGRGLMRDEKRMIEYLSLLEFLFNTLLFALGGTIWGALLVRDVVDENLEFSATIEWFWLLIMYLMVMAIRFVQVGLVYPFFARLGLRSNWKEAIFLSFAGMRGAVGIALALSLYRRASEDAGVGPDQQALVNSIFFLSGGISLCTLLINGTMAPWVLQKLGLVVPSDRKRILRIFEVSAEEYVARKCKQLMSRPRFQGASFAAIRAHVPFLTDESIRSVNKEVLGPRNSVLGIDSEIEDTSGDVGPVRGRHQRINTDFSFSNMQLEEFSERIASIHQTQSAESEVATEALVSEIRHMFLDTVYHAYVRKLQEGEIDDDRALVNNPEYMRQYLDDYFNPPSSSTEVEDVGIIVPHQYWWHRLEKMIVSTLTGKKIADAPPVAQEDRKTVDEYMRNRPFVQRTLAFIGAHRTAEEGFRKYIDNLEASRHSFGPQNKDLEAQPADTAEVSVEGDGNENINSPTDTSLRSSSERNFSLLQGSLQIVLDESQEQIRIAQARLDILPEDTVRKVQSHVLASILLRRLTRFVGKKVEDGTLEPKEAQVYLDMIATKSDELKNCPGDEVHHSDSQETFVKNKDEKHHPHKKQK
jgi:NhaP-type Na+/H+ or K+/H+ antiporter